MVKTDGMTLWITQKVFNESYNYFIKRVDENPHLVLFSDKLPKKMKQQQVKETAAAEDTWSCEPSNSKCVVQIIFKFAGML